MTPPRLGLVCDFTEDHWYSMDLVASMLFAQLQQDFSSRLQTTRIGPAMNVRFNRSPTRSAPARKADQFLNRFWDYPRYLDRIRGNFDLFHVLDHTYAQLVHNLPPERTVVYCHDLDAFRCLIDPARDPRSKLFQAMSRRILSGLQKAARVVCGSSVVRDEVLVYGLLPAERLSVIPYGVHPSCGTAPDPAADAKIQGLLGPVNPDAPEILHVGSTIARKRIETLLNVFAAVRKQMPQVRLLRAGGAFTPAQEALAQDLRVRDAIEVLPYLEREELASVYRRAGVVLQTSSAEGFGLPVAEAMACGTPVIASDLPVLREVGGSAALYCPVDDLEAWTASVLKLLSERGMPEWEQLRAASLAQAATFSWRDCARKMTEVYAGLLGKPI